MADILKEIYNAEITVADVAATGSIDIVTTDASTQFVVKDVKVNGLLPVSLTPILFSNGFEIASLTSNASGSEIVDVSSTLSVKMYDAPPVFKQQNFSVVDNRSTTVLGVVNTFLNETAVVTSVSNSGTTESISPSLNSSNEITYIAVADNGDFFYTTHNNNQVGRLYKRAGGVNGTETLVYDPPYGRFVFDGVDTFYYTTNNSTTLGRYNINTGDLTPVTAGTILASANYPQLTYMANNLILAVRSSSHPTEAIILDGTDGATTNLTGLPNIGAVSGNNAKMSAYYDPTTSRYTIYRKPNVNNLYITKLDDELIVGQSYAGTYTNSNMTLISIGNEGFAYTTHEPDKYIVGLHNIASKTDLRVYDTTDGSNTIRSFIPYETDSAAILYTEEVPSVSLFTDTMKLRLTGIQSTI